MTNSYTGAKTLPLDPKWSFRCMTDEECEAAYHKLMNEGTIAMKTAKITTAATATKIAATKIAMKTPIICQPLSISHYIQDKKFISNAGYSSYTTRKIITRKMIARKIIARKIIAKRIPTSMTTITNKENLWSEYQELVQAA